MQELSDSQPQNDVQANFLLWLFFQEEHSNDRELLEEKDQIEVKWWLNNTVSP